MIAVPSLSCLNIQLSFLFRTQGSTISGGPPTSYCVTEHNLFTIRHKWTIQHWDFVGMLGPGEKQSSSLFWSPDKPEIKCCLNLFPDGIDREAKGYLSLFLEVKEVNAVPISETSCQIPAKFELTLLEKRQNDQETEVQFSKRHLQHIFNKDETDWGFRRFVEKTKLRGHVLSVVCNMDFILKGEFQHICDSPLSIIKPQCDLADDLSYLLEDDAFFDVTIEVGGESFRAHKNILSARSDVFRAMFAHKCRESTTNVVHLEDTTADVWKEVLKFLYTARFSPLGTTDVGDILKVADKYNLSSLKTVCTHHLAKQINVDNLEQMLLLSYMHKADFLKTACMNYMKHSAHKIVVKPEWEELMQQFPDLTSEALVSVVKRMP